jgi:hypothetical protein
MKTKPTVFPPFNIQAVSRQALEPLACPREIKAVPLDDSPFVYIPAVSNYLPEPPAMFSASCQDDNYTSAVQNHNSFPPNSVYRLVTPSPSKSRTTFRDVSPQPMDIFDEGQIADTRAATPSPLIESTSCAGWPDSIVEQDVTPSTPYIVAETYTPEWINEDITPDTPDLVAETNTPEWIDEQDATPYTPQPVVAETNTPEWLADEDVTSISQYPILETATPFHVPEIPFFQDFVDRGADLIDLWSPSFEGSNCDKDESVLGASSLKDLDSGRLPRDLHCCLK